MTTTMNLSRTDLAVETAEALPTGRDMFAPGTGVTKSECLLCGCPVTRIHVHTPAGARAIGKPEGRYITMINRPRPPSRAPNNASFTQSVSLFTRVSLPHNSSSSRSSITM